MTEVAESGHHDLCFLGEPCSEQVAEHGFCSRQNTICIYCERECICERLKQAENYARIAAMHTVDVDSYEQGRSDTLQELRSRRIARWGASGSSGTPIIMSNGHWVRHDDYLSLFAPSVAEGQR